MYVLNNIIIEGFLKTMLRLLSLEKAVWTLEKSVHTTESELKKCNLSILKKNTKK